MLYRLKAREREKKRKQIHLWLKLFEGASREKKGKEWNSIFRFFSVVFPDVSEHNLFRRSALSRRCGPQREQGHRISAQRVVLLRSTSAPPHLFEFMVWYGFWYTRCTYTVCVRYLWTLSLVKQDSVFPLIVCHSGKHGILLFGKYIPAQCNMLHIDRVMRSGNAIG